MPGNLEIICGPSGVGKSSHLEGIAQSHRCTTRDPRPDELFGPYGERYTLKEALRLREEGGFFKSLKGTFVTEEYFLEQRRNGVLVAVHRYPDPENGHWYGYPVAEIHDALARGESLSEHFVDVDAALELEAALPDSPTVTFANLWSPWEIQKRLLHRGASDEREQRNRKVLVDILNHVDDFNFIRFIPPETVSDPVEARRLVETFLDLLEHGESPSMDYDTLHGIIALSLENISTGRTTSCEGAAAIRSYIESAGKDLTLVRTYPSLGNFDSTQHLLVSYFRKPTLSLPFILEHALDLWGMDAAPARRQSGRITAGVEAVLNDTHPVQGTFFENQAWLTFHDDFAAKHYFTSHTADLARYIHGRPSVSDHFRSLIGSGQMTYDDFRKELRAYVIKHVDARTAIVPGLHELSLLRFLGSRCAFEAAGLHPTDSSDSLREALLFESLCGFIFTLHKVLDPSTYVGEQESYIVDQSIHTLNNIFYGRGLTQSDLDSYKSDFHPLRLPLKFAYAAEMQSHTLYLASEKAHDGYEPLRLLHVADYDLRNTLRHVREGAITGVYADALSATVTDFNHAFFRILDAQERGFDVVYPAICAPAEFVRYYWFNRFPPARDSLRAFSTNLHRFLDAGHRVPPYESGTLPYDRYKERVGYVEEELDSLDAWLGDVHGR